MAKKRKISNNGVPSRRERLVRNKHISIALNEREYRVLERFYKEFNIKNKSKFLRDTIIRTVWNNLMENEPSLFSEEELKKATIKTNKNGKQ